MIYLALGSNLPGPWGSPVETLRHATRMLADSVVVTAQSGLYRTTPVGPVVQPDFVNAVIAGTTALAAEALLERIKALEALAGRQPGIAWGPRHLDIDILDYDGQVQGWRNPYGTDVSQMNGSRDSLVLPHPELHRRAFVLVPLSEIAPDWRHPVLSARAVELRDALGPLSGVTPIVD